MKQKTQFSIRTLLATTLFIAFLLPVVIANYSRIVSYFNPDSNNTPNAIVFPNLEKLEADFKAAKADRNERIRRLLDGTDSVDDAMERLASHDFIKAESFKVRSGWIMTSSSGSQFHRAALQRQSQIFEPLGETAVPDLLNWLEHPQIEIRYIASYTLKQLTGLSPDFSAFATLEQLNQDGRLAGTRSKYENWLTSRQHHPPIAR